MSLTTDYVRIQLEGKVSFLDATYLLRSEADCRLGQTETGESVDSNSSACQDFLEFVHRTPDLERITGFDILPYNQALAESSGIDTSWILPLSELKISEKLKPFIPLTKNVFCLAEISFHDSLVAPAQVPWRL
jgi:hypothetical protein